MHVLRSDGLTGASPAALRAQRALVESLGGSYHQVVGDDVAAALLEFARGADATQLVVGTSRRNRWARAFRGGVGGAVIAGSGEIDVHIVTHSAAGSRGLRLPPLTGALTPRRRWAGLALAVAGIPAVTAACLAAGSALSLASVLLVFLLLVVAVALVGGLWPALLAAGRGWSRTGSSPSPPAGSPSPRLDDLVALAGYLVVAVAVATVVDRGRRPAGHRGGPLPRRDSAAGLAVPLARCWPAAGARRPCWRRCTRPSGCSRWPWSSPAPSSGPAGNRSGTSTPCRSPTPCSCSSHGRALAPRSGRWVAFAEQARAVALSSRAGWPRPPPRPTSWRPATACGRRCSPRSATTCAARLAGISRAPPRCAPPSWRSPTTDRAELVETVDESADRLAGLVDNLLDMSRLQAGRSPRHRAGRPGGRGAPGADLAGGPHPGHRDRPRRPAAGARADPGLLERVVANLVDNAAKHAPVGPLAVTAGCLPDRVELRVVDRGPGCRPPTGSGCSPPSSGWATPRPGTASARARLGRGPGAHEAMGGTLDAEDTPAAG